MRERILPVMRYLLSECPRQERGHLASGYDVGWAVLSVSRRVAPLSDPSGAELVDIALEDGVVIVDKQVAASVVGIADGAWVRISPGASTGINDRLTIAIRGSRD